MASVRIRDYRSGSHRRRSAQRCTVRVGMPGDPAFIPSLPVGRYAANQPKIRGALIMTIQGTCPKCDKRMLHVNIETVVGLVDGTSKTRCISLSCIHCHAVLGVEMDRRAKPRSKTKPAPKD